MLTPNRTAGPLSVSPGGRATPTQRGRFYSRAGKRLFDVGVSAVGLVALVPVLVLCAVVVKLSSPGPVFFRQVRVGKDGRLFRIAKFRSMKVGADRTGPSITVAGDPRVTKFGMFLRWLKLDELPQLWNVLIGEMSLVGPRPEVPRCVGLYPPNERQRILSVRPGITAISSVVYRWEEIVLKQSADPERFYIEKILPQKLTLDLEYVESMSFCRDLYLLFLTVQSLFSAQRRRT